MFSNTAYEALYQYLGLSLHGAFIKVITSHQVFMGVVLLVFGVMFFLTALKFFSRYMPGALVKRQSIPLSSFFRIVLCLFLGMALLKVGSETGVKKFDQTSWHTNSYIQAKLPRTEGRYEVSFVFDLLSRSAEELSRFASRIVDSLFSVTNSETQAPSFFYKAVMFAGSQTVTDSDLRNKIAFYTEECFEKAIPLAEQNHLSDFLDRLWATSSDMDRIYRDIPVKLATGEEMTCLEVKNEVREHLKQYANDKSAKMITHLETHNGYRPLTDTYANFVASNVLVNHYLDGHEAPLGIHKGSQVAGTAGRVFQYLNRLFSWDGLLGLFGQGDLYGAALTAKRSQEFSENLQRAPHVAGFVKMVLIFIFPWLVFFVVAGRWKVLIYWYALYISVLLWTPIWTLFYHIMTSLALSTETMTAFGKLTEGVSLYSAQLITSRMYHFYSVYSWVQLLIGPGPTMLLAWHFLPLLRDSESESAPEFISDGAEAVKTGVQVGSKAVGALG